MTIHDWYKNEKIIAIEVLCRNVKVALCHPSKCKQWKFGKAEHIARMVVLHCVTPWFIHCYWSTDSNETTRGMVNFIPSGSSLYIIYAICKLKLDHIGMITLSLNQQLLFCDVAGFRQFWCPNLQNMADRQLTDLCWIYNIYILHDFILSRKIRKPSVREFGLKPTLGDYTSNFFDFENAYSKCLLAQISTCMYNSFTWCSPWHI